MLLYTVMRMEEKKLLKLNKSTLLSETMAEHNYCSEYLKQKTMVKSFWLQQW